MANRKKSIASAPGSTVFERFEAIARRCGDEPAYVNGEVSMTYAELDARAKTARARILSSGPSTPGMVGILTTDRLNALVAILGCAASGHAYVLLDVNDPDKRLGHIIEEAKPFAILADTMLAERAQHLHRGGGRVIELDNAVSDDGDQSLTGPVVGPDSLLYVSFTSGSTGVPKGVCQTHRNLIFYVDCYIREMEIAKGSRISWLFAHGASASNMDIYGALFTGARLCAFEIKEHSFAAMADWIDEQEIALLHTVPTVVRELVGAIPSDKVFNSVRVIDLAGEMLFANDVRRMRPHFGPDCRILNRLAATEASFISSLLVTKAHEDAEGALPVGKAVQDVEVGILREDGSTADAGETGLIAISSPHVCVGYLNRPDLNAEAFSEVNGKPGWRRYKSADLGFIDAAGDLNFIGRTGSRIKLRGQAVDLAEVEAALYQCPDVTGAVILPRSEAGEEAREILAYLTLAPGSSEDAGEIRKQLSQMLPAYMLPSGYILLDSFPYTATSKVDRKALAELELDQVRFRPGYVPPEDEIEEKVAAIFAEVLDIQGVGRLDDFFLLGGDSLSLVNLQILATETFGQQLAELHEDASVKGVADWLRAHRTGGEIQAPILLPVRTEGTNPPLFVVHGRRGQAHVGPHFLELLGRDQPLYALQARGLDGRQEPHRSVEAMAAEYVAAIQEVQPKGPYFIGGFCAGSYVAIEVARLLYRQGEKFYAPLLIDPPRPNFAITAEDVSEELLLRQLERRVKSGIWKVDLHNDTAVRAAIDVARAFDEALRNYRPQPFPIRSLIIATVRRWRNRFSVKRVFGPNAQVLLIDGGHGEILSADNVQFARAVKQCVAFVATAARRRQARLADEGVAESGPTAGCGRRTTKAQETV